MYELRRAVHLDPRSVVENRCHRARSCAGISGVTAMPAFHIPHSLFSLLVIGAVVVAVAAAGFMSIIWFLTHSD